MYKPFLLCTLMTLIHLQPALAQSPAKAREQAILGHKTRYGQEVKQNSKKAIELIQHAAAVQNPLGLFLLCEATDDGFQVPESKVQAQALCKQALPGLEQNALRGDVWADYALGYMYYMGLGTSEQIKKAETHFLKAGQKGHISSQSWLGNLYRDQAYEAEESSKKALFSKAHGWYLKAAKQGSVWAMKELGDLYLYGYGVTANPQKALDWYHKAIQNGDVSAMVKLGKIYELGEMGIAQDLQKSENWLLKAAQAQNTEAMVALAEYYRYHPPQQDTSRSQAQSRVYWLEQAARQGHVPSINTLGELYAHFGSETHSELKKDVSKAIYWFKTNAKKGDKDAIQALERIYENKLGPDSLYQDLLSYVPKTEPQTSRQDYLDGLILGFLRRGHLPALLALEKAGGNFKEKSLDNLGYDYDDPENITTSFLLARNQKPLGPLVQDWFLRGKTNRLNTLLKVTSLKDIDVNIYDLLKSASTQESPALLKILKAQGYSFKATNRLGQNLLFEAAKYSKDNLEYLHHEGLDIHAIDAQGNNLLFAAFETDNLASIDYLLSQGVSLKQVNQFGENAAFWGLKNYSIEVFGQLDKYAALGLDLEHQLPNGKNLLLQAIAMGMIKRAESIYQQGVSPWVKDTSGKTGAEHLATWVQSYFPKDIEPPLHRVQKHKKGIAAQLALLKHVRMPREVEPYTYLTRMSIFQTIVETYGVDSGGVYPPDVQTLYDVAQKGHYWKPMSNEFNGLTRLQDTLIMAQESYTPLDRGKVVYEPIRDKNGQLTAYKIYAVNLKGQLYREFRTQKVKVLTNM